MIPYRYVPTGMGEGTWGFELDRSLEPLFDPGAPRAFYADVFQTLGKAPPGPEDVGLCHSIALPGEVYAWRLAHLPTAQIVQLERSTISSFRRVFTLSSYFEETLRGQGLTNVSGVLRYPTPIIARSAERHRRVVIAQRYSEEKMPALVIELARRMPDVEFTFVSASPPEGLYRVWLELASPNVSTRCFPGKAGYYAFLAQSGCGLVATLRDNFGVSALDCLAAGRPYVAPDMFAYAELVLDRQCRYEPFSLRDMERAVRYAFGHPGVEPPWTREDSFRRLHELLA